MRAHGWLANNAQKWEYGRTVAFSGSRYSSEYPLTRASARIVSKGIDAENAKRGSATKHLPPELSTRNISPTARSRSDKIVNRRDVTNWLNELSGRYHHEKLFRDKKCKSRRNARRGCLVSRQLRPGMAG